MSWRAVPSFFAPRRALHYAMPQGRVYCNMQLHGVPKERHQTRRILLDANVLGRATAIRPRLARQVL